MIALLTIAIAHTQPWEMNANSIGFTGFGFFGQTACGTNQEHERDER